MFMKSGRDELARVGGDEFFVSPQVSLCRSLGCETQGALAFRGRMRCDALRVRGESVQGRNPRFVIVAWDKQRGAGPVLAEARKIAQHKRATGERGFQDAEAERLITRRRGVDRSGREVMREDVRRQCSEQS